MNMSRVNAGLIRRVCGCGLGVMLASPGFAATQTIRYEALVDGGKNAGHQIVTTGDDGVTHVDFIFKDNGRGPELKEEFAFAPDGTFSRYQVKGASTFGAAVDESFVRTGDKAQWHSTSDKGEQAMQGGAGMYTPLGGSHEAFSVAIGALARRADGNAGKLLSPHIVPAGFIEGESAMSARNGFVIKNLDEAKHAVDWYHAHDYPRIKIYNSFPHDLVRPIAAYAHSKGMRVSGHTPAFMRARETVEQGYDEIQHINQVLLNFYVTDKTDTRTLERFYLPPEKTADLDFDSKPVQDFIALLVGRKTVLDPTLATFEFLHQRDGEMSPIVADIADHLPPDVQRGRRAAEMKIPDDATAARYTKSFDKMVEFVGRAYKAGIPIVAGTDELPGFTLQRELELYVRAGLTPSQALQVATWNGAKYARVLDDRGSIAVGKRADLVLVDRDPTTNISDIRKVALVLKDGNAYYPSEINSALGIKPFADPVRVDASAAR